MPVLHDIAEHVDLNDSTGKTRFDEQVAVTYSPCITDLQVGPEEPLYADPGIRIIQPCQGIQVLADVPADGFVMGDLTFRLEAEGRLAITWRWNLWRAPGSRRLAG